MGDIQWHHHDLGTGTQHSRSRLWIHVAVELGCRSHIATFRPSTAHPNDLFDPLSYASVPSQGNCYIRQGAKSTDRYCLRWPAHDLLNDKVSRVLCLDRHRWFRQVVSVESGLAVHVLSREQRTGQRSLGSGECLDVLTLGQFQDRANISDGMMKRDVAGDSTDTKNFDQGRTESR